MLNSFEGSEKENQLEGGRERFLTLPARNETASENLFFFFLIYQAEGRMEQAEQGYPDT